MHCTDIHLRREAGRALSHTHASTSGVTSRQQGLLRTPCRLVRMAAHAAPPSQPVGSPDARAGRPGSSRPRSTRVAQPQQPQQQQAQELEIPSREVPRPPPLTTPGSSGSSSSKSQAAAAALDSSLQVHMVQWYPGHIAKAERQLKEQLKMVDVVLEVRDARIIRSTSHPQVPEWVGSKPRLLVINRSDMISPAERRKWSAYFNEQGYTVFWTDGKLGAGTTPLRTQLLAASEELNAKRARRGLQPRPVRSCVIGFPNIGKSALINRLLSRKVVDSAPKPGVTRLLKWVRLGGELDMLDAPGVIPAAFNDQIAAQRLAMCNDIGEAAYTESLVAAAFIVRCKTLPNNGRILEKLQERYKIDPLAGSAEDFVVALAQRLFFGDVENAGARILKDYRNGLLGAFALELPDDVPTSYAPRTAAGGSSAAAKKLARSSWGAGGGSGGGRDMGSDDEEDGDE